MIAVGTVVPSVADVVAAALVWVALLGTAGALIGWRVLRACANHLERAALLPALGTASLFGYHELTDLADVRIGTATLTIWMAVTALVGLVPYRGADERERLPRWFGPALAAIAVMGAVLWVGGITGSNLAPAGADAPRHAFFVTRIIVTESNDATDVLLDDVRSGERSAGYYPLTLHTSAAVLHEATGLAVAPLLAGCAMAYALGALIPGVALLARRLADDDGAAVAAALVGAVLLPFPFLPLDWGAYPMIVGLCVVPVAAVSAARRIQGAGRVAPAVAGLLACYAAHNTQLLMALVVTGTLVAGAVPDRRGGLRRTTALALAAIALALPDLIAFAGGIAERTHATTYPRVGALAFARHVVTFGGSRAGGPVLVSLAALLGSVQLWRRAWRAYAVLPLVLFALGALASQDQGPVTRALTLPFYGFGFRLSATGHLLCAPAVGLALATAVRRVPRGPVLAGVAALALLPSTSTLWLGRIQRLSTVGPEQLQAFDYLAAVDPGDQTAVLTERAEDGGMWMYSLTGTVPLFGFPVEYAEPGPYWRANLELLDAVADPASAPATVARLAQRRCVGFVYSAEHPDLTYPRTMHRDVLRTAPFLQEELALPTVSVFRIRGVELDGCRPVQLS